MWRYFSAGVGIISNLQTMPTLCGGVLKFHNQRESLSIFFILVYKCSCFSKIDVHFLVKKPSKQNSAPSRFWYLRMWDHFEITFLWFISAVPHEEKRAPLCRNAAGEIYCQLEVYYEESCLYQPGIMKQNCRRMCGFC